jgi:uncharacterized membrane protein
MGKVLLSLALGVIGAGIVHIAILFLLPALAAHGPWQRLDAAAGHYTFVAVDRQDGAPSPTIRPVDPFFDEAACRFDLKDGVVHVHAPGHVPFWSMSVYDRQGENIYSLTDRTATDGDLDLVIATPAQLIEVKKDIPEEFQKSIFVETNTGKGIALVRSFVPDGSWAPEIDRYMKSLVCQSG